MRGELVGEHGQRRRRARIDDLAIEHGRAAQRTRSGRDPARGITAQDAAFLTHQRWELATVPSDEFPLLLHHHPLSMYRRQVLKQADVVMAMFLLGNEFDDDEKRRNSRADEPSPTCWSHDLGETAFPVPTSVRVTPEARHGGQAAPI